MEIHQWQLIALARLKTLLQKVQEIVRVEDQRRVYSEIQSVLFSAPEEADFRWKNAANFVENLYPADCAIGMKLFHLWQSSVKEMNDEFQMILKNEKLRAQKGMAHLKPDIDLV